MHYCLLFQREEGIIKHEDAAATAPPRACRAGRQGRAGSAKEPPRAAAGQRSMGERVCCLEGQLIVLSAYFFICFIQFLQRVQQFLWGENLRGS